VKSPDQFMGAKTSAGQTGSNGSVESRIGSERQTICGAPRRVLRLA
jgi:hypothetical protein